MAPRGDERVPGPTLAQRLKAHRLSLGISQAQAARELEVARTAYRLWELEAARPSADRWSTLARWMGIPMTTLLAAEGLLSEDEGHGPSFITAGNHNADRHRPFRRTMVPMVRSRMRQSNQNDWCLM